MPHSVLLAPPQPWSSPAVVEDWPCAHSSMVRYTISHPLRSSLPLEVIVMSTSLPVDTNHLPPFGGKLPEELGTVKP